MSSLEISNIEPFRYDSAPINASPEQAADVYYGVVAQAMSGEPMVPAPQGSASAIQINEHAVQDYLARVLRALTDDLVALDARVTALEP